MIEQKLEQLLLIKKSGSDLSDKAKIAQEVANIAADMKQILNSSIKKKPLFMLVTVLAPDDLGPEGPLK